MAKRSNFERRARDAYFTPIEPVLELRPHLPRGFTFCEPCAGDGRLVRHLEDVFGATCVAAYDIHPLSRFIRPKDSRFLQARHLRGAEFIVSNIPWKREIMHELIGVFSAIAPTWLLLDADWWHTKQCRPFRPIIRKVVSVGRVKWIEESSGNGKDNSAWYLFDRSSGEPTQLFGMEV